MNYIRRKEFIYDCAEIMSSLNPRVKFQNYFGYYQKDSWSFYSDFEIIQWNVTASDVIFDGYANLHLTNMNV